VAARQREEALRQAFRDQAIRNLQHEIRGAIEMTALSSEQLQAIVQAGEPLRQRPPRTAEEATRRKRMLLAEQLLSPVSRELARTLGRLTPEQCARLGATGEIALSSDPRSGDLPLLPATVALFRASQPNMSDGKIDLRTDPSPNAAQMVAHRQMQQQQIWEKATGYRVVIQLDRTSLEKTTGSLTLQAAVQIPSEHLPAEVTRLDGGTIRPIAFLGGVGTWLSLWADVRNVEQEAAEETRHRVEFEKDPVLGTARGFQPATIPGVSSVYAGLGWLRDLLTEIARTYDVDFIADAYWTSAPVFGRGIMRGPTPLYRILDRAAGPYQQWERRGRLIRMRSRTWFFARPREVPLRLVRRWQTICRQQGALPIEEWIAMVGTLGESQLASLPDLLMQAELPSELGQAHVARHLIRLYDTLSPNQREALWQGQAIPIHQLSAAHRHLLASTLHDINRRRGLFPPIVLASDGAFSMIGHPQIRTVQRLAGRHRYLDEPTTASTLRPTPPPPTPEAVATVERHPRHPILTLHFRLSDGSRTYPSARITVAQP
jgi:hypothetical protein